MNKEKQIEEMQKDIMENTAIYDSDVAQDVAETLVYKGYRKQRHGTWYHGTENGAVYAKCSACGRRMNYSCYGYAYYSLCGARMDGAKMKGGAE